MLSRTLLKFNSSNLKSFACLESLNKYLSQNRFAQNIVYFRSNWNPQCEKSDQQVTRLAQQFPGIQIIRVDSDTAPKIAKHYGVKSEPQYVFCLYGDEVVRHIGVDYNKLVQKVDKVEKLAHDADFSALNEKWVPYGTYYKAFYERFCKQEYQANVSDI